MELFNLLILFFFYFGSSIIIISYGTLFQSFLLKKNELPNEIGFKGFLGFLFLFFLSNIIRLFININNYIISLVLLTGLVLFIYFLLKQKISIKSFFYFFLLLVLFFPLSIIAEPSEDFFYYYLPYLEYLYTSNILVGLVNINDILAFSTNSLFDILVFFKIPNFLENGFSVLILIFYVFFIHFLIDLILKNKNDIFYFLILCLSLISFAKLRDFGTTTPPQLLMISTGCLIYYIYFKDFTEEILLKIIILATLAIILRFSSIIILPIILIPLLFNYRKNLNLFLKIKIPLFFLFLVFFIFLIKNILHSGCLVYPAYQTCFTKLAWSANIEFTKMKYKKLKSDSMGWPFYAKENFNIKNKFVWKNLKKKGFKSYDLYASSYPWFWAKYWIKDHNYKKIINLFFITLFAIIFLIVLNREKKLSENKKTKISFFGLTIIISAFIWFIISPQMRYGGYFIFITLFCFVSSIIINYSNKRIATFTKFLFICLILVYVESKNLQRIYSNINNNTFNNFPWPNYTKLDHNIDYVSSSINNIKFNKRIKTEKNIFDNQDDYILMCGDISFPCIPEGKEICTGLKINKYNYSIILKNKNTDECYNFMINNIFY